MNYQPQITRQRMIKIKKIKSNICLLQNSVHVKTSKFIKQTIYIHLNQLM